MPAKIFSAVIEKISSRTGLVLPFDADETWGKRAQHHVSGLIQGITYRGALLFEDGRYLISIGPTWLRDAHLNVGDAVQVTLEPEGPQVSNVADDIAQALSAAPEARAFFDSLPTFYRKNYIRWIEDARQARTRAARIEEMIRLLAAGQREH